MKSPTHSQQATRDPRSKDELHTIRKVQIADSRQLETRDQETTPSEKSGSLTLTSPRSDMTSTTAHPVHSNRRVLGVNRNVWIPAIGPHRNGRFPWSDSESMT